MVTVLVHEMIGIAFVLLSQLFHDFINIFFSKICGPQGNGFLELECLPELNGAPWRDLKNATEGVRVPAIGKLSPIDLDA